MLCVFDCFLLFFSFSSSSSIVSMRLRKLLVLLLLPRILFFVQSGFIMLGSIMTTIIVDEMR